ncbi:MAG: hypothetical protein HY512_03885 [Candidatus Aenigmarchaeota archaeon]|nr:hypothetical protein [Candidatus Aenigmarchaeota archaeon]
MFRKIVLALTLLAGCATPQNKSASLEYLRDSRDFSTLSVYGGAEIAPKTRFFGNVDLNSPFNRADTTDLTRFNGRARLVRSVYNGFGLTTEYKDSVGDNNAIGGFGVSYSPVKGIEVRAYPLRTDGESQEVCLSFARIFEMGRFDPYVRGFFDVGRSGKNYSVGEIQVGVKTERGWRFGAEIRHSDVERRNGFGNPSIAVGIGVDF